MVDTKDLKSFGYCSCVGSSPTSGTILSEIVSISLFIII